MRRWIRAACLVAVIAGSTSPLRAEDLWKTLPEPAQLPRAAKSGIVPVNDIRMHYEIYNAKGADPVILLHGGLGCTLDWGNQVPALAKRHRVIALDSRGQGRSTRSDKPFDYHLMATDVVALMDRLKLGKASIVGWSDGGIIGLDMAIHYPDRVNKLFAYGANYNAAGLDTSIESNPMFALVLSKMAARYRKIATPPADFDSLASAMSTMWATEPDFKPEELGRIQAPTLIADGQYEEGIKPEHTAELARLIPGARIVTIPNVGHMGPWQDPAGFNRVMTEFLDAR